MAAKTLHTVQVKSLSRRNPVPFGTSKETLLAEYVIICRNVHENKPQVFIARTQEILQLIHTVAGGSLWLEPKSYEGFEGRWDKIGDGFVAESSGHLGYLDSESQENDM